MVSLGGFDTHAQQVVSGATDTGTHARLLSQISVAVNAFQDDLKKLNIADRVLGMTFSEFGRRIISNDSLGTDHGAAAPLFLFGTNVNGGLLGTNPIIPGSATVNDNIPMQYDFRSVYSTILKNWFGVTDVELNNTMLKPYPTLNVINTSATGLREQDLLDAESITNYPNPCNEFTTLQFNSGGGLVRITLFDSSGKLLEVIKEATFPAGASSITLNTSHLATGLYYYQIQQGSAQVMKNMLVVR
jgi:hypothetical protein